MKKKNVFNKSNSIKSFSFKNNNIKICFILFSSNKSVENLVLKLNNLFLKVEYNKSAKDKFIYFCVSLALKNYFLLKNELHFQMEKESFKFEFVSIVVKSNNVSVLFFENNFINIVEKEEIFEDVVYSIYYNFIINNILNKKIFLFLYFLLVSQSNYLKYLSYKKFT